MIRAANSPQAPGPGGGGMSASQGSWSLPRHRSPCCHVARRCPKDAGSQQEGEGLAGHGDSALPRELTLPSIDTFPGSALWREGRGPENPGSNPSLTSSRLCHLGQVTCGQSLSLLEPRFLLCHQGAMEHNLQNCFRDLLGGKAPGTQ